MADVETTEVTEAEATATDILEVFISKAKKTLSVNVAQLPDDVYREALAKGLQSILGRGMAEIKTAGLEGAALAKEQDAALAKAEENLEKCYKGEIRFMAVKKSKAPKGKIRSLHSRTSIGPETAERYV